MTLFDVLFKRRKFLPLYENAWKAIKPHLSITADPEDKTAYRLALFYFASVVYSTVYQAAVASGMSTSSAYSLARIHLDKCSFEADLLDAVDAIFSAEEGSRECRYAEVLQAAIGRIVATVTGTPAADAAGTAAELEELGRFFAAIDFAKEGLYPPSQA